MTTHSGHSYVLYSRVRSGPGACGCPEPLFEGIVGKVEKPTLTQQLGYPLALPPPLPRTPPDAPDGAGAAVAAEVAVLAAAVPDPVPAQRYCGVPVPRTPQQSASSSATSQSGQPEKILSPCRVRPCWVPAFSMSRAPMSRWQRVLYCFRRALAAAGPALAICRVIV